MPEKKTNKLSHKVKITIVVILAIVAVTISSIIGFFLVSISAVDASSDESVTFVLESGWGVSKVASSLKDAGLIRNAFTFKVLAFLNDSTFFQSASYDLKKSMSADEIIDSFIYGENVISNTITITFVEGKRFTYYAEKIATEFGYSYDDIIELTSDTEYLETLINNYWFLDKEILNEDIYYPLEGYLFPDTYEFKKDATIEEIIAKMLDAMGTKLEPYKDEIELSGYSIHSLLTLASVVELEAVTAEDRITLAGIFYNRLNAGWTLGSDVTTYYATGKDITESLTVSDLNDCNAYNTRGTCVTGLPVGPICSPAYSSIIAAITPEETDYYYFVADKNNKLYFGVTADDHEANIRYLKENDLWPE